MLKILLDIEISVVGMNLNLPKEKIDIILHNDNLDHIIKTKLIWKCYLNLFQEKEEDQKIKLEQENKIKQLTQEIYELKQNIEEKKILTPFLYENNMKNDLNKSKIITDNNMKKFELVKKRLKIFNKDKSLKFIMLYSAKIHGDKSQKFHELCDNHKNTLILIKTELHIIFGGYAGKMWNSLELGRKKDIKSFLFSIDKQKIYNPKPDSKFHLFCSDNDGPCFYAFSINDLCLKNGGFCDEIYKCNYDSFETEYELNNGEKAFKIDELEIYEVKLV